jgi:hypothetical protein
VPLQIGAPQVQVPQVVAPQGHPACRLEQEPQRAAQRVAVLVRRPLALQRGWPHQTDG